MLNVGVFATGLDTYWNQFDGLKDNLDRYRQQIINNIQLIKDVNAVDAGMVDSLDRALAATELLNREGVDVVFIYVATYCLSSTILPIAQRLNCPVIILNLQPTAAIDYQKINSLGDRGTMTGLWLENCQACSVPEIANVFKRSRVSFELVTGYLDDPQAWKDIYEWIDAAKVYKGMRDNRLGILGHYYGGMLDVYTDITLQSAIFGTHVEILEMCELKQLRETLTEEEIDSKVVEFQKAFDVSNECEEFELKRAAATSVALDKMVEKHKLGSLAYYYEGEGELQDVATSVIAGNTLLTGKSIPVAGECEVKNVQAMKILSLLGVGGSFSEFYALDFIDDVVMLGHDGPAHFQIAEGRVGLVPVPVYHGKPGKGLSIQMTVKHGPVTVLSVCEEDDHLCLLVAEGESVEGHTLQIGNTNSGYKFSCGAKDFINNWSKHGPSHHCAIGVGHVADKLKKVASLFNIPIHIIK